MVASALGRFTQLLLAAAALVACAGGPSLRRDVTVRDGESTVVALVTGSGRLQLSLQNDSARMPAEAYAERSADPSRKIVADADLQALLDVWSEMGLFAQASPSAAPDALDVLLVDHGGRRFTWSRRQRGAQSTEKAFHDARDYFLALYNSNVAYHGTTARPNFGGENQRAQTTSAAARARLEQLRTTSR
jgi:hypothetical protein